MLTTAFQKIQELNESFASHQTDAPEAPEVVSWEEFENEYLSREDEFIYEWVNGEVVKTRRTMNPTQLFIQINLLNFFYQLKQEGKVKGQLVVEGNLFFPVNVRRPDLAWVTDDQVERLADGKKETPRFTIEIISSNDLYQNAVDKMEDYRAAGVQVVWHIFPKNQLVHEFAGDGLSLMRVCRITDICSANLAVPGFEMPVEAIFKRASK